MKIRLAAAFFLIATLAPAQNFPDIKPTAQQTAWIACFIMFCFSYQPTPDCPVTGIGDSPP